MELLLIYVLLMGTFWSNNELMMNAAAARERPVEYGGGGQLPVADEPHRACIEGVLNPLVQEAVRAETRMGASLLRLHFHDCFVHGCDGSLLLDEEKGEKFSAGNANSLRGFELVDSLKASITSQCQVQISCADILALAARAGVQAVSVAPGQRIVLPMVPCPQAHLARYAVPRERKLMMSSSICKTKSPFTYIERYDSKFSYANLTGDLPGTDETMDQLLRKFAAQGISDVSQVVALIGGGHSIGLNHCTFAKRRLYGKDNTNLFSDPEYVAYLEQQCPETQSAEQDAQVTIALDNTTMEVFDNGFFMSLSKGRVGIKSDQRVGDPNNAPDIRATVELFTRDQVAMFQAFSSGMETMGRNGLLGPDEGEIRIDCHHPNGNGGGNA